MPGQESPSETTLHLAQQFSLACGLTGPLVVRAVHRGTGAELTFNLDRPHAFVGRARPMEVRLDDPSVSQCHAYLQVIGGMPYCFDLGSRTGVLWEDGTETAGWVPAGQAIRIGTFNVWIETPGTTTDSPHPGHEEELSPGVLEVYPAPGRPGTSYPLEQPVTLIGRHPNCQLRFIDEAVGYFHCSLVNTRAGVWCVALPVRSGTLVNGRPIRVYRLREGDLIELGKVTLLYRSGAQTGQPLAVTGNRTVRSSPPEVASGLPQQMAEAFTPLREMMEQFQQCFLTMARMFTSMQQEHASMMCEQMRHVQELTRELGELRAELRGGQGSGPGPALPAAPAPVPAPAGETPQRPSPPSKPAQPRAPGGADPNALTDAHAWFLEQLAKLGPMPPPPPPK